MLPINKLEDLVSHTIINNKKKKIDDHSGNINCCKINHSGQSLKV